MSRKGVARLVFFLSSMLVCATALSGTSAELADTAKKWNGSIVRVSVLGDRDQEIRSGAGFVIGPDLVVTCYHLVAGGLSARVKTADGIMYPVGGVLAANRDSDLVLLSVRKLGEAPHVELGDAKSVKAGDSLLLVSSPSGSDAVEVLVADPPRRTLARLGEIIVLSGEVPSMYVGSPVLGAQGKAVGVLSTSVLTNGRTLSAIIPADAVTALVASRQETPTAIGLLKPEEQTVTPCFGILPPRTGKIDVKVPKNAPHDLPPIGYYDYDPATVTATIDGKRLERIDRADDLAPGRFVRTALGIIKFHESAKNKKVVLEFRYTPYRYAVYLGADQHDWLKKSVESQLKNRGDEMVFGPEVDAVFDKMSKKALTSQDAAKLLNCARMIAVGLSLTAVASGYSGYLRTYTNRTYSAEMVGLVVDLNTGTELARAQYTDREENSVLVTGVERSMTENLVYRLLQEVSP